MPKGKISTQHQPDAINVRPIKKLNDEQWITMGQSIYQLIDMNLGNRGGLEESLNYGNALYEMQGERANPPWDNCASINVPVVFQGVSEMTSRLAGSTLIQRTLSVAGSDAVSTQYSHLVEQFYNSEYENNGWRKAQRTCIQLAARDGTSILEVLWEKKIVDTAQMVDGPVMDDQGNPKLDEYDQPIIKKQMQTVRRVEWDAVRYNAVELRDFILLPNYAPSIDVAQGIARKVWMDEQDMWAMVESGTFKKEAVEKIISYAQSGQDEQPYDRQGNVTYTIGGKISIADYSLIEPEGIKISRGPFEIWKVLTRQYDFGYGFQDTFVWIHDISEIMAGYAPYEYEGGRPYFPLSVMPRANRFYGFSVPDIVGDVQEEATAQRNCRLDWMDYAGNPMPYATDGWKNRGEMENRRIGPGVLQEVNAPDDFGYIKLGDPPMGLMQEEQSLIALGDRALGAPAAPGMPPPGAGAGGKQSARAAQQQAALQGMQTNDMIVSIRDWMKSAFKFTHLLYVKYGKDQMGMLQASSEGHVQVTVPREVLAQPYILGINGQGGPLDKENRRQDAMALYQMGMQNPLVSGDISHVYNLTRNLFETFDYPDVTGFIGTQEQAQQKQQMQQVQQQAQQKEQMAAHIIEHAGVEAVKPAAPPGQPQQQPEEDSEGE